MYNFNSFVVSTGCPTKHDSSELMNDLECRLPNTGLDLKTFCSFVRRKNLLLQYMLIWDRFYYNKSAIYCLVLFSLVSNNLTNYGRRHFKIFSNCHDSWDTLYNRLTFLDLAELVLYQTTGRFKETFYL